MKAKLMSQLFIISVLWVSYSNSKAETSLPSPSNAQAFAAQAGFIAGAASACGQDTNLLLQRASEVILAIAKNSTDKIYAEQAFRSNMITGQVKQNNNPAFSCAQVIQDYNNLPILRSDYQQAVIEKLAGTDNSAATISNNPPATIPANPTNNSTTMTNPSQPTYPNAPMPNPFATPPAANPTTMPANTNSLNNNLDSTAFPPTNPNPNTPNSNWPTNPTAAQPTATTSANVLNTTVVPQQYVAASPAS